MLASAGVLIGGKLQPPKLNQRWLVDAVQLFWDRQIFDGALPATAKLAVLEQSLMDNEIYKLLRCKKDQCRAFARAAFPEYSQGQGPDRRKQISSLQERGLIAA